jgi:hypothetical protein
MGYIDDIGLLYEKILSGINSLYLGPDTKIEDILRADILKVYRSSLRLNKNDYRPGAHAGTLQQSLIRADYMVNDEERYDKYYLYELSLRVSNIYPKILDDDGSDHSAEYVESLKGYHLAFYKNTGEGDITRENLSVIIIDPKTIISSKIIQKIDKNYLLSIQDHLYLSAA